MKKQSKMTDLIYHVAVWKPCSTLWRWNVWLCSGNWMVPCRAKLFHIYMQYTVGRGKEHRCSSIFFFFFFSTLQTACITSELFSRNLLSRNSVCMVFHDTMYKRQLLTSLLHVQYFYQLFLTTPFSTSFPSTFSLLSELHTKDVQERQIQLKAKLLLTHISR